MPERKDEELTKEDSEQIAMIIAPIVNLLRVMEPMADLEKWRKSLNLLHSRSSHFAALPWPTTQNKAVESDLQRQAFEAIYTLFKTWRKVRTELRKGPRFLEGEELLRKLGLS